MSWLYCFTDEGKGKGVIHMIVRLGPDEERIDVRVLRRYWENLTGARQIKIKHVGKSQRDNLASYLANQKRKKGLASELIFQSAITKWRWSSGWLPPRFTRSFGRFWAEWSVAPPTLRLKALGDWINACSEKGLIVDRPRINHTRSILKGLGGSPP